MIKRDPVQYPDKMSALKRATDVMLARARHNKNTTAISGIRFRDVEHKIRVYCGEEVYEIEWLPAERSSIENKLAARDAGLVLELHIHTKGVV